MRKVEESGNTIEMDIESTDDPIHAGQIFAEMLVAISHPEFNSLEQEVCLFSPTPHVDKYSRHSWCSIVTLDFSCIIANSLPSISYIFVIRDSPLTAVSLSIVQKCTIL